jgi:hypothetical protein
MMMPGDMDGMEMTQKKLGQLSGASITRIVKPAGVRLRCEFVSAKHPSIEFEISGDLALGLAKEIELLLPPGAPKRGRKRGAS